MAEELFRNKDAPPDIRSHDLLSRMTLEEKLAQLGSVWGYELLEGGKFSRRKAEEHIHQGIGGLTRPGGSTGLGPEEVAEFVNSVQRFLVEETRLGIPALVHEECLSGVLARGATLFPQPLALASTWMPELAQRMATCIQVQMRALGARQGLAPVVDVARDPRWGRVEETFGEDPYLVASMGTAYVRGLQGPELREGVVATLKHLVGYGASEGGLNCAPAHIPERELREIYLLPFECAIREGGALAVMNSYGELDGVPCAASYELLREILREEWGFPGVVVSDYGAIEMLLTHHRLACDKGEAARMALEAGIDLELPRTDCFGTPLRELVESGAIPEALVDQAVFRVLKLKFLLGLFEHPYVEVRQTRQIFPSLRRTARTLAKEIAAKSLVLLKNDGILPLKQGLSTIAVIGPSADNPRNYLGDYHFPSHIELFASQNPGISPLGEVPPGVALAEVEVTTVLQALKKRMEAETRVLYTRGCDVRGNSREGFAEAVQIARAADVAILVVGDRSGLTPECTCGETRDTAELALPGLQEELVREVATTGVPVILVLLIGRPYVLTRVIGVVNAALVCWLPGETGGEAIVQALVGEVNPGGKLPLTFPRSPGQLPICYGRKPSGGRSHWWKDYVDLEASPLFSFGHGICYTEYRYSALSIHPKETRTSESEEVEIAVNVRNVGKRAGDEVVQLYVGRECGSVTRPVMELKGFVRISLGPGEEKNVVFRLPLSALAYYDREMVLGVEPGEYAIMVGSSAEDIRLRGELRVIGEKKPIRGPRPFFSRAETR